MAFAAEALLDLSTSSSPLPPTKDTSTQADLSYSDIDCLVAQCKEQSEGSELRLNVVVDNLERKWLERIPNLNLIHGSDGKTRFYTGLPTCAVFMALLKFIESYTHYSSAPTSQQFWQFFQGRKKCLSITKQFLAVLMRLQLGKM